MESSFYDGTKLLSLKDINGQDPEIFICESNRSAGKTTYFNRLAFNRFFRGKVRKIAFLYRFNYELDACADKIFKDIKDLFFPEYDLESKPCAKGIYHRLYISSAETERNKQLKECGYAIALNSADQIKKHSHLFSDIDLIIFDEFQSETGHYCPNEITKFISVHTSIARGQGSQVRYVPVIMVSNPVSIINPYYSEMGIAARLSEKTRFLKGAGFVLEKSFNAAASEAQQGSGFFQAFAGNKYTQFSAQSIYLNDNLTFISSPKDFGFSKYVCTIKYNGKDFAIREYPAAGIVYADQNADLSFPLKLSVSVQDHDVNYLLLKNNDDIIANLKYYFNHGCFRFKNLESKEAVFALIGIC